MTLPAELTAAQLRRRCDPAQFAFATTAEAPGLETIIGQERATRAVEFGMAMPYPGYNVFATGPAGAGKSSILTRFLEAKAAARAVPADWGYTQNFSDPDRPRAVRLPPGGGVKLREQVNALLGQVADALDKMFASDQYAESHNALGRELDSQRNARFRDLDAVMRQQGFVLARTPTGMMVAPAKDGEPLTQEQFDALAESEREVLSQRGMGLQEALERTLRQVQDLEEDAQAQLSSLQQMIAAAAIRPFFDKLTPEYGDWPDVLAYLAGIQAHLAEHTDDFGAAATTVEEEEAASQTADLMPTWLRPQAASPFDRYRLNVIVDNSGLQGAPVIVETNPTYPNLIGRVEIRAEFGTLVTDYRQIKAGALHRANGGYLLLDARVLLRQPLGWEALKQALRNARVRIEDLAQQMGVLAAATLVPEPIPLDVKVVLIGDPETYYALYAYDEQFEKLFKVRADFATEMAWTSDNEGRIVRFIRGRCEEYGLPHFDASGVARVIEYSGRLVEDQRKLTTRFAHVADVIQEAAFWAGQAQRPGPTIVIAADVQTRHRRAGLSVQPVRGADARTDHRRHNPGGGQRRSSGAGQRPGGAGIGRLCLRPAQSDHLQQLSGPRRGNQHRARGPSQRPHPRQGHLDPHRLPGRALRAGQTAQPVGQHCVRAILRGNRRRQRFIDGAVRAALKFGRSADQAGDCGHRLGEPAR